ncbi:putative nucleotide-binding alpha-beta plait domain-containing protein [Rosa chinensis]|uniref:Putative nucleotide-binding alpha-beta plait domain-containing protein n=1 Tax=Rosa chinensis TaxID=74649 RepID=A0A2P6RZI3_ROSCH|nr:putative nucleotide-binding alpha-beta plait domain-containing protein [Rosa chinensis]
MTTRIALGVGANLLGQHSARETRTPLLTSAISTLRVLAFELVKNCCGSNLFEPVLLVFNVYVPKDRVMNLHQGYRFVEFRSEQDADYISFPILKLLYSSPIPVKDVVSDYKFVVLTAMPAIKVLNMIKLYGKAIRVNKDGSCCQLHLFSVLLNGEMREPETRNSRGFGFISYDSFEASDAAIEVNLVEWLKIMVGARSMEYDEWANHR